MTTRHDLPRASAVRQPGRPNMARLGSAPCLPDRGESGGAVTVLSFVQLDAEVRELKPDGALRKRVAGERAEQPRSQTPRQQSGRCSPPAPRGYVRWRAELHARRRRFSHGYAWRGAGSGKGYAAAAARSPTAAASSRGRRRGNTQLGIWDRRSNGVVEAYLKGRRHLWLCPEPPRG